MDAQKIIEILSSHFPGRANEIITFEGELLGQGAAEVMCEIDEAPGLCRYIRVLASSERNYHVNTPETYHVLHGRLTVRKKSGREIVLNRGDSLFMDWDDTYDTNGGIVWVVSDWHCAT